jgi:hypothetical protein
MENRIIKFLSIIFICQALFFGNYFKAKAAWPTTILVDLPAAIGKILQITMDTMIRAAKHGAITSAMSEVNQIVGNGPGGPLYITNWREALEEQPNQVTQMQMQNLFTTMGKGRNGTYVDPDGNPSAAGNMLGVAAQSVMDMSVPQLLNMAEYGVNDPKKVFNQRNMRAFMTAYGSVGRIGNPVEATLFAADAKGKMDIINRNIASAQAIANGGYYSKMAGGEIITPGSTLRDMVNNANNMSFVELATSKTIQEAVGGLVSRAVSGIVKKGIRDVKKDIQKDTGLNVDNAGRAIHGLTSAYQKGYNKPIKGSF